MKSLGLGAFAIFTGSSLNFLTSCTNKESKDEAVADEHGYIATENTKEFETETHIVCTLINGDYKDIGHHNIEVPNGYRLVDTEIVRNFKNTYYTGTEFIFVNIVPVIADEYIDEKTGEVCYPYVGTIKELELNKQYSKKS